MILSNNGERREQMRIFTERAFRERLFEERERAEKEQRLNRNLMEIQHELFDLKCRIEQLEHKNCKTERNE